MYVLPDVFVSLGSSQVNLPFCLNTKYTYRWSPVGIRIHQVSSSIKQTDPSWPIPTLQHWNPCQVSLKHYVHSFPLIFPHLFLSCTSLLSYLLSNPPPTANLFKFNLSIHKHHLSTIPYPILKCFTNTHLRFFPLYSHYIVHKNKILTFYIPLFNFKSWTLINMHEKKQKISERQSIFCRHNTRERLFCRPETLSA